MGLESGKISNLQMTVLVIGLIFGTTLIIPPAKGAGHDAWIAVLIGVVEALIVARVVTALGEMFIDKTAIEISELVFGRFLGKVVCLMYLLTLFHILVLIATVFTDFFTTEIYPNTPRLVVISLGGAICASAARRGIETIARTTLVLVTLTLLIIISDSLMSISLMEINNILPVLDISPGKLLFEAHSTAMFPLAQVVALAMVLPFLNHQKARFAPVAIGTIIAGIFLALVAMRNSLVLGPLVTVFNYPTYTVLQIINIRDVFSRLEVLVTIFFIFMAYTKASILLYCISLGTAQMCKLRSYYPLIIPTAVLVIVFCLTNVRNPVEYFDFVNKIYSIYSTIPLAVMPVLTLIIARLRKLPQSQGVSR
ncbi:MAG: endospore germination permease [Syntrophomonas sp.]